MLRKLAALAVLALSLVVAPLSTSAHAESYGPKIPTVTHVSASADSVGDPVAIRLYVTAADGTSPAGTIDLTITSPGSGQRVVARVANGSTVAVSGSPVHVRGPNARAGQYFVGGHFTPTNSARYLDSHGSATTGVGATSITNGNPGSGGLPNTGGPALGWLITGLALVGGGVGAVAYARRRVPAAA